MRKVTSFQFITLNGYYKGLNEDISWHKHGQEEGDFSSESLKSENLLLFGRTTFEMMANFWPSPMAHENFPIVAEGMNRAEKIVFSKTLKEADWNNTNIINNNIIDETQRLKRSDGKNMTILGSGSIVSQFADAGLIDAYQIMIDPVVIGKGTSLFKDIRHQLDLRLTGSRTFKSGVVLLSYEPNR